MPRQPFRLGGAPRALSRARDAVRPPHSHPPDLWKLHRPLQLQKFRGNDDVKTEISDHSCDPSLKTVTLLVPGLDHNSRSLALEKRPHHVTITWLLPSKVIDRKAREFSSLLVRRANKTTSMIFAGRALSLRPQWHFLASMSVPAEAVHSL